jgi:hypothetical protein
LKTLVLAPLLLTACVGSWPAQSYVSMPAESDTLVLAPAISDCIAEIVPPTSSVALLAQSSVLDEVLIGDMQLAGLTARPDGIAVTYVVAPIGQDAFIRVTADQRTCSQFFFRSAAGLHVGGPQMVLR